MGKYVERLSSGLVQDYSQVLQKYCSLPFVNSEKPSPAPLPPPSYPSPCVLPPTCLCGTTHPRRNGTLTYTTSIRNGTKTPSHRLHCTRTPLGSVVRKRPSINYYVVLERPYIHCISLNRPRTLQTAVAHLRRDVLHRAHEGV